MKFLGPFWNEKSSQESQEDEEMKEFYSGIFQDVITANILPECGLTVIQPVIL